MATITIELIVEGLNPFDDEIESILVANFSDTLWGRIDGVVTVTWTGETNDAVDAAQKLAQRICKIPNATPIRWSDDFVGHAEIARRIGVTDEAVRLWAINKRGPGNFPKPWAYIGSKSRRVGIWRWADVSNWLVNQLRMETEESFPSPREIDLINSWLCWMDTPDGRGLEASYTAPSPQGSFGAFVFETSESVHMPLTIGTINSTNETTVAA